MTEELQPRPHEASPGFHRLTFYSLLTGLTPIIPLPFVDDWTRDLVRRRLTAEIGRQHGQELDSASVKVLALGQKPLSAGGCLRSATSGCVFGVVGYLIKKFFRKIIIFLLVKDCVDTFSKTFHQGYLLHHALVVGAPVSGESERIRSAIEEVTSEVDPRPVEQLARRTFRGSWGLLRRASRHLARVTKPLRQHAEEDEVYDRADLEDEEPRVAGVVDQLAEDLESQTSYLRELERRLENLLDSPPTTPESAGNAHGG